MKKTAALAVFMIILVETFHCIKVITDEDVKECGTSIFSRVNCSSVNFFYRECLVPGATEVKKIKLGQNFSQEICKFEISFGFRKNAVWVTEGCSGEFYVCYEGDRLSSTAGPSVSTVDIPRESTKDGSDNATLYIAIAVTLAVLALVGLIAGCLLKRRQSSEKSRKLAEKRQMSLEARDNQLDDDAHITPIKRHNSVESVSFPEGTVDLDKYEKGSVCSSRSSTSGFVSLSSRANGRFVNSGGGTPSGRLSLVLDPRDIQKGRSVPDIRSAHLEQGTKSNQSYRGSQTSLESVQEVTSSENSDGQNNERRRKYIQKPFKYNTVGFRGNCVDNLYNPKRSGLTLPVRRTQTRALVHARQQSQDSGICVLGKSGSDMNISFRPHYEDPQSILGSEPVDDINIVTKDETADNKQEFQPISPAVSDNIYSTVQKPKTKPLVFPKPRKDIYCGVNKSSLPVVPRCESPGSDTSLEENNNEHLNLNETCKDTKETDDEELNAPRTQHYALMHTFKPRSQYEEVDISGAEKPAVPIRCSSIQPAKF